MTRRIYLDTGVLITAWRGLGSAGLTALELLDDPGLLLVVSEKPDPSRFSRWHNSHLGSEADRRFYRALVG